MASQFYNVTTNNGDAKIANAIATATKLNITHVAFGDGNGSVPTPDKSRTAMVNEVYRVAPSNYFLHPTIANRLIVEAVIPSNIGGFYIREVGLIADTTVLISDGSVAPIFKEASTDGTREYKLKFAINIVDSSIANITLDSSLVYVTQDTIVDNLTTDDSTKVASARTVKELQDNKLEKSDLKDASTEQKGVVQLNNTLISTSTTEALTAAQGKKLNDQAFGVGQSLSDITSSIVLGATYTNTTQKTISIIVTIGQSDGTQTATITYDGSNIVDALPFDGGSSYGVFAFCFQVDPGKTYSINKTGSGKLKVWRNG